MRLSINPIMPLAALLLLNGCLFGGGQSKTESLPAGSVQVANGPASDYPIVIGDAYTIDGTTYKPADTMNYDMVGYAALGSAGGNAISGANKMLPLPSYVEVTSLDSGKTILVRLERRGPMSNDRLIELSPGAAAQLGVADNDRAPVRVRRVNPPEIERAALRSGQPAPYRMDTPKSLLTVLNRKLNPQAAVPLPLPTPVAIPSPAPSSSQAAISGPRSRPAKPSPIPKATTAPAPAPSPTTVARTRPAPAPKPAATAIPVPPAVHGSFIVQVGAFSGKANADASAAKVGGGVTATGRLFRVRIGPFASQAQANAALAKVRSAGYRDARIQHAD